MPPPFEGLTKTHEGQNPLKNKDVGLFACPLSNRKVPGHPTPLGVSIGVTGVPQNEVTPMPLTDTAICSANPVSFLSTTHALSGCISPHRSKRVKIEIGESLLVSWLKHVKECQLVQTNWKASSMWELQNKNDLDLLMSHSASSCSEILGYNIYKKTSSLDQLLAQAEIDVLGVNFSENGNHVYAIDVAFHEAGLNYGSRDETVARVIKKILRTAMCIHGYFNSKNAQIIFSSPKINQATYEYLTNAINIINEIFSHYNMNYDIHIIANHDFNEKILSPVLNMIEEVADTSELFMRSLQLYNIFAKKNSLPKETRARQTLKEITPTVHETIQAQGIAGLEEMKVGVIARTMLRDILESGKVPIAEIEMLQSVEYSKRVFDLQFPLLLQTEEPNSERPDRYYAKPLKIHGRYYFMCSEWYEKNTNNDRPYLIRWLSAHNE